MWWYTSTVLSALSVPLNYFFLNDYSMYVVRSAVDSSFDCSKMVFWLQSLLTHKISQTLPSVTLTCVETLLDKWCSFYSSGFRTDRQTTLKLHSHVFIYTIDDVKIWIVCIVTIAQTTYGCCKHWYDAALTSGESASRYSSSNLQVKLGGHVSVCTIY
jgi:hypothetical protein